MGSEFLLNEDEQEFLKQNKKRSEKYIKKMIKKIKKNHGFTDDKKVKSP